MAINNTTNLPYAVGIYYNDVLLSMESPRTIHAMGAKTRTAPKGTGKIYRSERDDRLPTTPVPLGDSGITPAGLLMSSSYVDSELSLYATYARVSKFAEMTKESSVLNSRARLLGIQKNETEDELIKAVLESTPSILYSTGGTNGDVPTEMELSDVQLAVQALRNADGITMDSQVDATDKFGTAPVAASYYALGHTNLEATLRSINGFVPKHQYSSSNKTKPSEVGALYDTRFFLSSIGSIEEKASGLGNDVFNFFFCAMEAYATINLEGASEFVYNEAQFDGPLHLSTTAGWKNIFSAIIENESWNIMVKSTLKIS